MYSFSTFLADFLFCFLFLYQSNPYKATKLPAKIAKLAKHAVAIIYDTCSLIFTLLFSSSHGTIVLGNYWEVVGVTTVAAINV